MNMPERRQVIIWTNVDQVRQRHMAGNTDHKLTIDIVANSDPKIDILASCLSIIR